ncbi:MAG TPA: diguanylate cyclase [Rhodocyclaceae bacterium]
MIPFEIHSQILAMMTCVIAPLLAIGNLIVWRQTRDQTVLWWAAGDMAMMAAASMALLPQLPGDDVASYALMALAPCGFWCGIRYFLRQAPKHTPSAWAMAALALLLSTMAAIWLARSEGNSLALMAIATVSAACAYELLGRQHSLAKGASRFVGALFAFNALFFFALAYLLAVANPNAGAVLRPLQLAISAESLILLIGWNFGVVMMAMQRYLGMAIELATHDDLTGVLNRRAFGERARQQLLLSERGGPPPSLLALDLDHFKLINDNHGHGAGDAVLCEFVRIAQTCLRGSDLFGRIGGEEFAVLLPLTGASGALALAERMRQELAATPIDYRGESLRITVSIGVAEHGRHLKDLEGLLHAADTALYRAKHRGRNCVELLPGNATAVPTIRLDWAGRYASGHPLIDAEHQYLLCMINEVIAKAQTGDDIQCLQGELKETLHWLDEHFRHEEAILLDLGWHEASSHVDQHRQLSARGKQLLSGIGDSERSFAELLDFLIREVIGIHLVQHDAAYFPLLQTKLAEGGERG